MSNYINFTKMQGLGNDFILVEYEEIKKHNLNYHDLAKKMCDRHFGIGADGLIIVNPDNLKGETDTSWRIINSDGSEPEMCGNGIRCFAKYAHEKGIVDKKKFTVLTLAGVITPEITEDGEVKVDMGAPFLEPKTIPTTLNDPINQELQIEDKTFYINAVGMGNPHCIIFSDEDTEKLALKYGPIIESHEVFPEKTNVEFVKVKSDDHIKINVWERGCGITLACGTGTCASAVASILNKFVKNSLKADLPGGTLEIDWDSTNLANHIFMKGPAKFVFEGKFSLQK